ncbi:hypothetical protein TCAL_01622 [Tigriopus californicus]|uniref:Oxysterol-binding protein n=1 Tax=Tigriopus californicus TaxID=6832 RepID=A0A553PAF6_TIGCA|nr:oxysterol-binding protein-related protein 9-like [Tigriopus californicus]TRY74648.1 hypothetical protein TCAL_01622 [Tigriopus californicus]|eukprot:TCALIF_01622-PA protein Name:"Similar to OSBPL9 Oxysterol-binding protein-related protein 9 (Pongo abelii)" AED:0.03 eAED:0.03 QI:418/1/1/1/1/1/5/373/716
MEEGILSKWTNVMKGWQFRWFVLDQVQGLFSYSTSREKMQRGVRRGCVRLQGAVLGIDNEDDTTFTITVDGKTFHFQATNSVERQRWIQALEDTIKRHSQSHFKSYRMVSKSEISLAAFEKRLGETDSYLQLLLKEIDQLQSKHDAAEDATIRSKYEDILVKAREMAEITKHAIVLLQIAKNASLPETALSGSPKTITGSEVFPSGPLISSKTSDVACSNHKSGMVVDGKEDDSTNTAPDATDDVEIGSECLEPALKPRKSQHSKPSELTNAIPATSYSSSEDEDEDFFDAEDEQFKDCEAQMGLARGGTEAKLEPFGAPLARSPSLELKDVIDYDALYDEDDSLKEDVDMKSHGSVITHLLSQVRIGMDLTKIVLPTFILERRSLLEMYSDFFAHPDLFTEIADGTSPADRMIRVLKWYLSSFHAGRKSSVAKKPYNPILGETFRCFWNLHETERGDKVKTGPLPWVGQNDLSFVAEQVSHHPPISAFYAEHPKKRITVNAHIYTKSSFLGMSVAVHNVGQGKLTLLDHKEEYICTFPSGYGRSILTVPWIELGGKVSLICPATGYSANIEFKCKQFFSSDVNKIVAEVLPPNSKKSILRVEGEWNGAMIAKWPSGKNEVFINVARLPIFKKRCKKVMEQGDYESRRLWRAVTYGLKVNDIDAATAAKYELEQRQREEAAERKASGSSWETKLFQPIGENWVFTNPLEKREPTKQ